jgi:triacylglycerol lipase
MEYLDRFAGLTARKTYHEQNALSLAVACDLAYSNNQKITSTIQSWGYIPIEVINKRKGHDIDTQCYIMADESNVVVVFRGTDSKEDWFANFQASLDPGPLDGTGAHEGFQDALFPAVISITHCIQQTGTSKKRIWLTGHSLGGALCSLYAGMLIENGLDVYGVYTFASPRPGSPQFEKQLNSRVSGPHYRVVNDGDIVPHLPPEPFFSHTGKRIILKTGKRERTKVSWLEQRIEALKHFIKITGEAFDIAGNHRLSADDKSYIPRLIKDLERKRT